MIGGEMKIQDNQVIAKMVSEGKLFVITSDDGEILGMSTEKQSGREITIDLEEEK